MAHQRADVRPPRARPGRPTSPHQLAAPPDRRASRRGPSLALPIVLALLGLLGSGLSFTAAGADPSPPPTVVFYGHGYGHGVGMSQYGARGRALAGQDAATILAHYYQGTTPGTTDPKRPIRILVLRGFQTSAARPLRLYGRGGPWTIDGIAATFPRDAQLQVRTLGTGLRVVVRAAAGTVLLAQTMKGSLRVRAGNVATAGVQVWSKPGAFDRYRGVIRLRSTASGIDAINETELDLYLRGVVPAEMPASWPVEALKAQAIASRSYAARRLHPGKGFYDLYDDTRSQVYRGSQGEWPTTNAVVAATAGQVLRSGTAIVNALYHSTGGGATEDNENVFTSASGGIVAGPVPYLRGSPDRATDGTPFDAGSPRAKWQTAPYSLAQLSAMFGADARTRVGTLTGLDLTDVGVSGRLIRVTLVGSLGSRTVSGAVFREVINARSPAGDPYMWSTLVSTAPIP
ncbi:MAG: SpoIID/LytB domain-containing protein [Chloroflexota bacterium]